MAGTIMHRSKIPIQDWFAAAYHMATFTPGISAVQLQRQLGLKSHDTVWYLLHRLRKGMVNDARSKISGLVEVDETFIGGPEKGKRGRGAGNKSLVVGAVEVLVYQDKNGDRCERAGRLRLALIPDATEESLGSFSIDNVMPKSRSGQTAGGDTPIRRLKICSPCSGSRICPTRPQKISSHPSRLQQSQDMAKRDTSRRGSQVSSELSGRVCFPV